MVDKADVVLVGAGDVRGLLGLLPPLMLLLREPPVLKLENGSFKCIASFWNGIGCGRVQFDARSCHKFYERWSVAIKIGYSVFKKTAEGI